MSKRPFLRDIRYRGEAALAYIAFGLFRQMPVAWASACGSYVARLLGPLSRPHKTARKNLINAFPEMTKREIAGIQSQAWENFGRVTAEYAVLSRLRDNHQDYPIEVYGKEHLQALAQDDKPVIIFSGHIANWEVLPIIAARIAKPPAVVYRSPNNPYIENLLQSCRGLSPSQHIPKGHSGARRVIREIRNGGIVGLLIDQKSNTGLPVPLFGRDAMTGDAVARIAIRLRCHVLPARVKRIKGCHFRVTFEEPWTIEEPAPTKTNVLNLLKRMNEHLESWVREDPGQWLWMHNRWPKDKFTS